MEPQCAQYGVPTNGGEDDGDEGERGCADQPQDGRSIELGEHRCPVDIGETPPHDAEHADADGDAQGEHPAVSSPWSGVSRLHRVDEFLDRDRGELAQVDLVTIGWCGAGVPAQ